jgi:hypothetical protein
MSIWRILTASAALFASMPAAYAGPCSHEIDRVQHQIDAALEAKAGTGPIARESTAATMHREPTPGSIAAAEERLGEISPQKLAAIREAMRRARAADSAGDKSACEQALADVQSTVGR